MAINPDIANDIGEHGQFISDSASGEEIFWTGAGADVPAFALPSPGRFFRTNGEIYFNQTGLDTDWKLIKDNDYHSGIDCIETGDTVTVEENKQMIVYRRFKNAGTLVLQGTLILRCS